MLSVAQHVAALEQALAQNDGIDPKKVISDITPALWGALQANGIKKQLLIELNCSIFFEVVLFLNAFGCHLEHRDYVDPCTAKYEIVPNWK